MSILKLDVGNAITLDVESVREVEGQFGPQLQFVATNGDCLYLSKDGATRQLERIGYTPATAAGKALLFEKIEKGGKKFTNINPAKQNGSGAAAKAGVVGAATSNGVGRAGGGRTSEEPTRPAARPVTRQAVEQELDAEPVEFSDPLYLAITRFVLNDVWQLYHESGIVVTADAASAMAATIYIQARRNA